MSEKKAQAPRSYGKTCKMPTDAPAYLTHLKDSKCANPELIKMVQANQNITRQRVAWLTGGQPLLKDNGC